LSTFILDFNSLESRTDKQKREIFSVLFAFEKFRKFKRKFFRQKLILFIYSNSFESFKQSAIESTYTRTWITDRRNIKLFKLIGTKQTFIEYGKEIFSHYNSNYRPFNAFSQSSCLRKCLSKLLSKEIQIQSISH
jgi:hypothetical protein